jgi:HSP20 family protein
MKTSTEKKIVPYKRETDQTPVRREEMEPFGLLRHEVDRLFDDFTHGFGRFLEPLRLIRERTREFSPVVDVTESDKEVKVNVELPGVDEKNIELSIQDGRLVIRGEKKEEKEEKEKGYYRTERTFGEFYRMISMPAGVDTEKVVAEYKKGLLSITIPKTEEARARVKKIPIKTA